MIRRALETDLDSIMKIVEQTIAIMGTEGNPQWDETYPARGDFLADIREQTLYVVEEGGAILGMACINRQEPAEYGPIQWTAPGACTVVHRLAVLPEGRGKGVGRALLHYAERVAEENATLHLKSDTYGGNEKMNGLLIKLGYRLRGHMFFKGKEGQFNCYEKLL